MPNNLPSQAESVNPTDLAALAASFATEDAELATWLDAHAADLAGEAEALDRLTMGLLF